MTGAGGRVAAYVDGFNLYNGMHDARQRRGLWLDLESMLASFLRTGQSLVAVHYFTALVTGEGRAAQQDYLTALVAHGRVTTTHVGRFQKKSMSCKACGARWTSHEEKESDVCLAVQLVEDAALNVFDEAFVVSADSDMKPAIDSVRRLAPDKRLIAVFPPRRSSVSLERAVDGTLRIFDRVPERHLLPAVVTVEPGRKVTRPARWH